LIGWVVREAEAGQRRRAAAVVAQFDPVRAVAIFVPDGILIGRLKFRNDHTGMRGGE
jgi:hypothetical protein